MTSLVSSKRPRIDPLTWLRLAIHVLQSCGGELSESELCEQTLTLDSDTVLSLICEHPSLKLSSGKVAFKPFVILKNRDDLQQLFVAHFPRAIRRCDLLGIYRFIEADVDELLFTGVVTLIDSVSASMVYTMQRPDVPVEFLQKWKETL